MDTISGGSNTVFTGVMYFPKTKLVYSGGSSLVPNKTVIISKRLEFSGPSYLTPNSGISFSAGTQTASLVE